MKRFVPLLLCVIVGCAEVSGGIHPFGTGRTAEKPAVKEVAAVTPAPDPAVADMQRRAAAASPLAARPLYSAADPAERHLVLPQIIEGEVDDWIVIRPDTNYPVVKYISLDRGLKVFPSGMLSSHVDTVVEAKAAGDYRMAAIAAEGDEPTDPLMFIVRVGHAPQPPPGPGPQPPGPNPPGPTPPPVVKAAKLIVVTIDDAKKRTPELTKTLMDPYWQMIRSKGHRVDQYNATNANVMETYAPQIKANGGLPTIVIMDAAGNKWLNKDPADQKLPANAESLKALLQKFTDNL